MNDVFQRFGLTRIINVSGTETPYGAAPVCREVVEAVSELVPHCVDMAELQSAASRVISQATGSESGCVTGCTAASIAMAVAATMTGCNLGLVEQLPDVTGLKHKVVMQKGHEVSYEHRVSQNVRLAGASIEEIGAATECGVYQLRHALTLDTTAGFYVVSHLTVQHNLIDLVDFCSVCHEAGVPVIVDAASQRNPDSYLAQGADLVLFSAHKAFDGLTAGIIAGREDLVKACIYQGHGIGRAMKPGKEAVVGVIAALQRAMSRDNKAAAVSLEGRLTRVEQRLAGLPGIRIGRFGRQIEICVDPAGAGLSAYNLSRALRREQPAVILWRHLAGQGILRMTLTKVSDETADYVCDRIRQICRAPALHRTDDEAGNIADEVVSRLEGWPLLPQDRSSAS